MESEDDYMRILFIVNPISGIRLGRFLPWRIKNIKLYNNVSYDVTFTKYISHAEEIAMRERSSDKYTHIIAVGGDGTVNEIARALVGSDKIFGIISLGSGNGLARHLGYSININKCLKQLITSKAQMIDVVDINGKYSFNVSGVGFDAAVASEFRKSKLRGITTYLYLLVKLFFVYKEKEYELILDGKKRNVKAFLLSIANSSQYGNNAYIAPDASVCDGLMDVCYIKRPKFLRIPYFAYCLMTKKLNKFSSFKEKKCKELNIIGDISHVHIDGDDYEMTSPVNAKVVKGSLRMIIPAISGRF